MTWDMTSRPQVHHFDLIHWLITSPTQGLINSEISNHQIRVFELSGTKNQGSHLGNPKNPQEVNQRFQSSSNNPYDNIPWKLHLNSRSIVINLCSFEVCHFQFVRFKRLVWNLFKESAYGFVIHERKCFTWI